MRRAVVDFYIFNKGQAEGFVFGGLTLDRYQIKNGGSKHHSLQAK